ncbi:hypothetical protein Tco_0301032 [Tanacetum coccineum]
MSRSISPIPPPIGTSSGNPSSPNTNRVDTMPINDTINTTTTTNVSQNVVDENLPQLLDSRGVMLKDQRPSNEFMADLNSEYHERALLKNQKRFYKRSGRMRREGVIKEKVTMTMNNCDERKHVLDNTHVDLHYVEDERKNLESHPRPVKIVKAFGVRGRRKEKSSSKEVVFNKADVSSSGPAPEITSDSESECKTHVPQPPLPKLTMAEPSVTSNSLISLADLTQNYTISKKNKQLTNKVGHAYVIKKKTETKPPAVLKTCSEEKADSFTKKFLLTLMEEVKGLKEHIKIPLVISLLDSHASSSKPLKEKTWFRPCKHYGLRNHFTDDCYSKPKCSMCGSTKHMTKDHLEQAAAKRTLTKLKA